MIPPSNVFPPWLFYSISTTSRWTHLATTKLHFSRSSVENVWTKKICFLLDSVSFILEKFCSFHAERKSQQHLFLVMSVLDKYHVEQGFRVLEIKSSEIVKVHWRKRAHPGLITITPFLHLDWCPPSRQTRCLSVFSKPVTYIKIIKLKWYNGYFVFQKTNVAQIKHIYL